MVAPEGRHKTCPYKTFKDLVNRALGWARQAGGNSSCVSLQKAANIKILWRESG